MRVVDHRRKRTCGHVPWCRAWSPPAIEVVAVSRGQRDAPYRSAQRLGGKVEQRTPSTGQATEASRDLRGAGPGSAAGCRDRHDLLYPRQCAPPGRGACAAAVQHFLHCGTIWVHGPSAVVPTTEAQPRVAGRRLRHPEGGHRDLPAGRRRAAAGFPATVLHPGAYRWAWDGAPINPAGHLNPAVFTHVGRRRRSWRCPTWGSRRCTMCTPTTSRRRSSARSTHWGAAVGESFHVVSPAALTLRGYAEAVAAWFASAGAGLTYLPWPEWQHDRHRGKRRA
jgi:hypothetical protein